jgi:hypothetical protein
VPRIDAPTIAQHRAQRRQALLARTGAGGPAEPVAPSHRRDRRRRQPGRESAGVAALTELGLSDPSVTASLISSVVYTASRTIEAGSDATSVEARVRELLAPFLLGHTEAAAIRQLSTSTDDG